MRIGTLSFMSAVTMLCIAASVRAEPIARVTEQIGVVFLVRDGVASGLGPGNDLETSDLLVTAADGKVVIRFADGSLCTVGPESEVRLADLAAPEAGWLDLVRGIVRLILAPGAREIERGVRTRAAVASVRSTEFLMDAALDRSAVFVADGTVTVTGRLGGGSVVLRAGEGTDVALREPPTPPKRWGEARVIDVIARTTLP